MRFVLTLRRDLTRAFYSSLFPYASASGPVLLAAVPAQTASREVPRHTSSMPLEFRLLAAAPRGHWQDYGLLRLTARDEANPDPPVSFDPVLNLLPGLHSRCQVPFQAHGSINPAAGHGLVPVSCGRGRDR
jgi:hypothetical protein